MYCIPQCIPSLKCDAMYLILDSHMDAYKEQVKAHRSLRFFDEEDFNDTDHLNDSGAAKMTLMLNHLLQQMNECDSI